VSALDRFKDYLGFAVGFIGIGYIALWPLAASGYGGKLFGASILCSGSGAHLLGLNVLGAVCHWKHPLTLSPTLHVMGFSAAIATGLRLLYRSLHRYMQARAVAVPELSIEVPSAIAPRHQPLPSLPPRRHFGLRGADRVTQAEDVA